MTDLIFKDEVYKIVGAAIEVHRELGPGFLEAVYHEALVIEFESRGIPFESEKLLQIVYKGNQLSKEYIADFICFDQVIVELKALEQITSREKSQVLNYLKAAGLPVGVLINFGSKGTLEWKRYAHTM